MSDEKMIIEDDGMLEEDMFDNVVVLIDEQGEEHEFELIDNMEYEDKNYVALIPFVEDQEQDDEDQEDSQLIILEVCKEDEEEVLLAVEDEAIFNQISEKFMERLSDMYDFKD